MKSWSSAVSGSGMQRVKRSATDAEPQAQIGVPLDIDIRNHLRPNGTLLWSTYAIMDVPASFSLVTMSSRFERQTMKCSTSFVEMQGISDKQWQPLPRQQEDWVTLVLAIHTALEPESFLAERRSGDVEEQGIKVNFFFRK